MGRTPCCDKKLGLKKGPWTPEEDKLLVDYIQANGHGSWRSLPKLAGLQRCGKSCRLRWTNYLRPDIKRGPFTSDEQKSIIQLHGIVGNKWSTIAAQLAGRTDNEIKNFWNTHLKKRLLRTHASPLSSPPPPTSTTTSSFSAARHMAQWESVRLEAEVRLSRDSLLFSPIPLATSASTTAIIPTNPDPNPKKEPVDVFLRMWNSGIGDAFRKQTDCTTSIHHPKMMIKEGEESSSCRNTKQSSAVTVSEVNNNNEGEGNADGVVVSGETREEVAEKSDETYQFYLDLAAGDDDLGLLQNHQGVMSCYSWFGIDLSEASLHDNPFK